MKKKLFKMLIVVSCLFLAVSCQKTINSMITDDEIALKGGVDWEESADDKVPIAAISINGTIIARCIHSNPNRVCTGYLEAVSSVIELVGYENYVN